MKKLANLTNVKTLSRIQQKNITGGLRCSTREDCHGIGPGCFICTPTGWCFDPYDQDDCNE